MRRPVTPAPGNAPPGWEASRSHPPRQRALLAGLLLAALLGGALLARGAAGGPTGGLEVEAPDPEQPGDAPAREEARVSGDPDPAWEHVPDELAPLGAWRPMAPSPLSGRSGHAAAWSGSCWEDLDPPACGEMLVWGGVGGGDRLADGAAYDPAADTWRRIAPAPGRPASRSAPRAVWTAEDPPWVPRPDVPREMLVWPAESDGGSDGLAYDPAADTWRTLAPSPLRPRLGHALVWTGEELLVWGGAALEGGAPLDDGAAYDPAADTWRVLPASPLPGGWATATQWDGDVAVWNTPHPFGGGPAWPGELAAYRPAAGEWEPLPPLPPGVTGSAAAHGAPGLATAAGALVLNVALLDAANRPVLAMLEPRRAWTVAPRPANLRRGPLVARGDGSSVVLWGGSPPAGGAPPPDGAVFYPRTGGWRAMTQGPPPLDGQSAVRAGITLLVWGGMATDAEAPSADGAVFDASAPVPVPER